jgi:GT2 family glycosyltransferase
VVVATLDRPESLRQVLRGLRAQLGSRPVEIVVADNNPASGLTPPVVREAAGVRLVPEPRGGLSFARNAGIRASSGEIVVTVDDDVVLPEGWLEQLLAPFADPEIGIVTGRIAPEALDTDAARAFETRGSLASGSEPLEADRAFFDSFRLRAVPTWRLGSGANVALRRSVLSAVGLFDEALGAGTPAGAGEESDLFYRALRSGIRLRYEPRAVLRHRHHRTMAALRRRVYGYSKGHVAYHLNTLLRHGDARALAQMLVAQPVDIARRLLRHSLIEGRYPASLIAWELLGYLAGPIAFARARLRARRLGAGHPGSHALPAAGVPRTAEAADVAAPAAHGQPG